MHICLSFGKLRGRFNGLGEFSVQLANNMAGLAGPDIEITVHADPLFKQWLGPRIHFREQTWWDRVYLGGTKDFTVWHTLSQFFRAKPPGAVPRLVTVHDLNYKYSGRPSSKQRGHDRVRRAIRLHDQVASGSSFAAQDIQASFQLANPVRVILDGATSLVGCPTQEPQGVLAKPYLFHVSRMSVSKNMACILDLVRGWPGMNFVLAGRSHRDTHRIQETLEREGLSNAQVLLDISEEEKAWLYDNCAGFLFPSLTEGFGLPPIEAMHFGKPTFLSRLTSLPEVGGEFANYLDTFDAPAVRAIIEPAIEPSLAQSRAPAVKAHAATFSWERCAQQYLALYEEMVGAPLASLPT